MDQLAAEVRDDEALMQEFQQITDEDAFVANAPDVAQQHGYEDVTDAESARTWPRPTGALCARRNSTKPPEANAIRPVATKRGDVVEVVAVP